MLKRIIFKKDIINIYICQVNEICSSYMQVVNVGHDDMMLSDTCHINEVKQ